MTAPEDGLDELIGVLTRIEDELRHTRQQLQAFQRVAGSPLTKVPREDYEKANLMAGEILAILDGADVFALAAPRNSRLGEVPAKLKGLAEKVSKARRTRG